MKQFVAERSKKEGFKKSRLPEFTKDEIDYIKGTYDFFGLNHYTTLLSSDSPDAPIEGKPSLLKDARATPSYDPSWPSSSTSWLKVMLEIQRITKLMNFLINLRLFRGVLVIHLDG